MSVSPGNNLLITAGQNNPQVVTQVQDAVSSTAFKTTIAGPGVILTSGTAVTATGTTTLLENYIDAFRGQTQFDSGAATQGVQFNYAFTGIPTGASETCTASANNSNTVTQTPATGVVTSAAPTLLVEWTSAGITGLTTQDTLTVACTWSTGTATTPLSPGSVTATVTLSPVGTAFGPLNAVLTSATQGQIPRYTGPTLGPVTITSIISATTNVLYPFVTAGGGFDTGLALANTGSDVFGTKGGLNGPVSVVFFPQGTGTPFCVATAAGAAGTTGGVAVPGISAGCTVMATVPGSGITSGNLNSGSTWAVLTSDLLKAATAPASFNGYIFAISNSPLNHGTFFVFLQSGGNFAGFSGGPALIVPNPALGTARKLDESLGH